MQYFVSYTKPDREWAEWIAWVIEACGHRAVFQAWDFRPGTVWPEEMHKAVRDCDATVCVLSPDFLESGFAASEWHVAFADDPTGSYRKLIPVRVRDCEPVGFLKTRVYVDLVGKDLETARELLKRALSGERGKPELEPLFPGVPEPTFPASAQHERTRLDRAAGTSVVANTNSARRVSRFWLAGLGAAVVLAAGVWALGIGPLSRGYIRTRVEYNGGQQPDKIGFKPVGKPRLEVGKNSLESIITSPSGSVAGYSYRLSPDQVRLAKAKGWKLTAEFDLKAGIAFANVELGITESFLVSHEECPDNSHYDVRKYNGTRYDIHERFVNGSPNLFLVRYIKRQGIASPIAENDPRYELTPGNHTFVLDYDVKDGAQAFVDEMPKARNYIGHEYCLSYPQVAWGVGAWEKDEVGSATFRWVLFTIKP